VGYTSQIRGYSVVPLKAKVILNKNLNVLHFRILCWIAALEAISSEKKSMGTLLKLLSYLHLVSWRPLQHSVWLLLWNSYGYHIWFVTGRLHSPNSIHDRLFSVIFLVTFLSHSRRKLEVTFEWAISDSYFLIAINSFEIWLPCGIKLFINMKHNGIYWTSTSRVIVRV